MAERLFQRGVFSKRAMRTRPNASDELWLDWELHEKNPAPHEPTHEEREAGL